MTFQTHKRYSVAFAIIEVILLYVYGLTEINYYACMVIALAISKSGALFPDVDHAWHNVKEKTITNKIINTVIHITGGHHRSWQTHSIDICLYFTLAGMFIPGMLYVDDKISLVNMEVISLIWLSFAAGWISHLFSDALTSEGVRIVFFNSKIKFKFVPKKIGKFKFNTGDAWEEFNYKVISFINILLGLVGAVYPFIHPYILSWISNFNA